MPVPHIWKLKLIEISETTYLVNRRVRILGKNLFEY